MGKTNIQYDYKNSNPPVADKDRIVFNGMGEDGHETFILERCGTPSDYQDDRDKCLTVFAFCKTAEKPYDAYVTAVLILAKYYLENEISISSDGYISEWENGMKLIKDKVGINIQMVGSGDSKDVSKAIITSDITLDIY